jgi:hypothetical protein
MSNNFVPIECFLVAKKKSTPVDDAIFILEMEMKNNSNNEDLYLTSFPPEELEQDTSITQLTPKEGQEEWTPVDDAILALEMELNYNKMGNKQPKKSKII